MIIMSIRKIFVQTWQNKLLMSGGKRKKICLLFLPVLFSWPVWTFVILAIFQYIVRILYFSLWYFPNGRIFIFNLWPGKMSKLHFCGQMSDVLELDTSAIYLLDIFFDLFNIFWYLQVLAFFCIVCSAPAYYDSQHWFLTVVVICFLGTIFFSLYYLCLAEPLNKLQINWLMVVSKEKYSSC